MKCHVWLAGAGTFITLFTRVASAACGGKLWEQGTLRSPNYPGIYPENASCTWNIVASARKAVLLQIGGLSLELNKDKLTIYDGSRARANRLKFTYTGQYWYTGPIELGHEATVVFTSDRAIGMMGFSINFTSVIPTPPCGGSLFDQGFFRSPNYPGLYPNNVKCTWNIVASSGKVVLLQGSYINLEQTNDKLAIYNGSRARAGDLKAVYAGQAIVNNMELGPQATVVFTSNQRVNSMGFQIYFTSVFRTQPCGGNLTEHGFFATPNYPYTYPNAAQCTWNIRAPPDKVLRFEIISLSLETNQDFLTIYDGNNTSLPPRVYSGFLWGTYIETGPEVTAVFTSNYAVSWSGFNITFSSIVPTGPVVAVTAFNPPESVTSLFLWTPSLYTDCGENLTIEGNFTSPNFPNVYPDGTYCTWHLSASPGNVLRVNVVELSLERGYDYLRIYNSGSPVNNLHYDYVYQGVISNVTLDLGPEVTAIFTSDGSVRMRGFCVTFTSVLHGSF